MSYQDYNLVLKLLGFATSAETPVDTDSLAQSGGGNGLLMGEAAINNSMKRFWIGMGRYQAPIEISNVIILKESGETPSLETIYNAGTLIINTVDSLAWVGTGNQTTNGSFVSINGGGVSSLDGGTF
jgi:hypothetical protein